MKSKKQLLIEKLEWLHCHNKNLTKAQYFTICECLDIARAQAAKTGAEKYAAAKERIRQEAIDWQQDISERPASYEEYCEAAEYFRKNGKKYGLLKEFHENGIC